MKGGSAMKRIYLLGLVMVLGMLVALGGLPLTAQAQTDVILYGIKQGTSDIYQINAKTGEETLLASTGLGSITSSNPNGIGYDTVNNRIYLWNPSHLYFWDGAALQDAGAITGSAHDGTFYKGKFYYIAAGTDDLYIVPLLPDGTIDTVTGITKIDITGNTKSLAFGDIDIRADGMLFGSGRSNGAIVFFTYNLNTNTYNELSASWFGQIAFGSNGILYATPSGGSITGINEINTNDGSKTDLGIPLTNSYTDITSGPGCPGTLTIGYWKNHAVCGNASSVDPAWYSDSLNGGLALFFCSDQTYCDVMNTPPKGGNAYYILAQQYIAAQLNQANGQDIPPAVLTAFNAATTLLGNYCSTKTIIGDDAGLAKDYAKILDKYNNGLYAPGHCAPIQ
jgi:hypothetical protein